MPNGVTGATGGEYRVIPDQYYPGGIANQGIDWNMQQHRAIAVEGGGSPGPTGPQGVAGIQGVQGPQGVPGQGGPAGIAGSAGPTGPAGPVGGAGPPGNSGNPGVVGPTGPQGIQGTVGAQGLTGNQGPAGLQGSTGPQGNVGIQGSQGVAGPTGPQGSQGPVGAQGNVGPSGSTLLATLTANNSAFLDDHVSFTGAYNSYEIEFVNVVPVNTGSGNALSLQFYVGGSLVAAGYNSLVGGTNNTGLQTGAGDGLANGAAIYLTGFSSLWQMTNQGNAGFSGVVRLHGANGGAWKYLTGFGAYICGNTPGIEPVTIGGFLQNLGAITGIRVQHGAGNLANGTIYIRGVK